MEQRLLAVTSDAAIRFFYRRLYMKVRLNAEADEIKYVSSVLANYSMVSRHYPNSMPAPADLGEVFDNFIYTSQTTSDPEILEAAGGQTLFLNGFFRRQMVRRHSVEWYDQRGAQFYIRLSEQNQDRSRQDLFERMAIHFQFWALNCSYIAQDFHPQWKPIN